MPAANAISNAVAHEGRAAQASHLIVGIGASAGGLDAFRAFFTAMPSDSGMAFVLIQHLDPDYDSALAEIIGECTGMPVTKAVDGTVAAPNTVAVIPQNAILKIQHGVLRVATPETPTARRSSIDAFLVSLAEDQGENAVGIILSGFGSDGTIGIEAIKEAGGLTLSEAAFDHRAKFGMPQSAVVGGFVDYVLQPHEMPARLLEYRDFKYRQPVSARTESAGRDQGNYLATICAVLNSRLGRDFGQYKSSTLMRRVRRRMQVLHIENPAEYIAQLRKLPNEPDLLFREILIGVTRFFRDPAIFDTLAQTVVPELIANGGPDEPIRLWVAGCATGEEAYSLAIVFKEALARAESIRQVTIFATDIDDRAVTVARGGLYSDAIEADITADRLARHFVKEGPRYRVAKHIREMCVFSTHDLVKDPPFSKLDLVSCRNLLIYFELPLQKRVISTFHYGIKANGFLWLGPSETIAASARLFKPFDKHCRIFRRLDVAAEIPRPPAGSRIGGTAPVARSVEAESIDAQAARIMAQYTPAYIVFDSQHEIQRFSGPVARFMEPVSGGASLNLFRMLHAQLRPPVRSLIRKALEEQRPIEETVTFQVGSQNQTINLVAEPMAEQPGDQRLLLLVFQEVAAATVPGPPGEPGLNAPLDPVHSELVAAREKLQIVTEELETANEELQSSNEEFQSVNEELHSTVEELETSKEELQSINEELQTVNAELNNRADSLVRSNSDLANLFDSTSIATLFLDNKSHIRRFTPAITEIFNVREGDEGRLISDFSSRLAGSALTQDIEQVLRDLGSLEREAESQDGTATYLVRVKPYRDLHNIVDGVVITLIDISERKKLERDQAHLAAIVASSADAIISHDLAETITSWNAGAEKIYGYTADEMIGQPMATLLDDAQIDEWPNNLARLRQGMPVTDIDISRVTKGDRVIYVSLTISPMRDAQGTIIGASAVARDIAMRKVAEDRTEMLLAELDHRVKNILAVVSSVVNQTLKAGGPPETARAEIEGRIQAISRAHSLLTDFGGIDGSLRDLVTTELSPYAQRSNVTTAGDDVVLTSRANLSIALAIHELATNSAKYGALSTDAGHLDVTWRVTGTGSEQQLEIMWLETAGPPVIPPASRGFGTRLIELSLVRGLKATVNREFLKAGVQCQIAVPLTPEIGRIRSAKLAESGL